MQNPLYFAYGSNLLESRLKQRVGIVRKIGTITLKNYELTFGVPGPFGSFANIKEKEGSNVQGVLYSLTQYQQRELDGYEGWPRQYKKFYFTTADNLICYAYIYEGTEQQLPPPLSYINIIIKGARENKLKETVKFLTEYKKLNLTSKPCRKKSQMDLSRKLEELLLREELKLSLKMKA